MDCLSQCSVTSEQSHAGATYTGHEALIPKAPLHPRATNHTFKIPSPCNLDLFRGSRHRGARFACGRGLKQMARVSVSNLRRESPRPQPIPPRTIGYSKTVADSSCQIRSLSFRDRGTRKETYDTPSMSKYACTFTPSACRTGAL
jgi:hypothetical protein